MEDGRNAAHMRHRTVDGAVASAQCSRLRPMCMARARIAAVRECRPANAGRDRARHRLRHSRAAAVAAARLRKVRQDQRFHIRACRGGRLKV
jgi:hypothetical protein